MSGISARSGNPPQRRGPIVADHGSTVMKKGEGIGIGMHWGKSTLEQGEGGFICSWCRNVSSALIGKGGGTQLLPIPKGKKRGGAIVKKGQFYRHTGPG